MSCIKTDALYKYYGGNLALCDINLRLEPGKVYGLLGPNGAGKSTLCNILATALLPELGEVDYFGLRFSPSNLHNITNIRRLCGYLPSEASLPDWLTLEEYLLYSAASYGLLGDDRSLAVNRIYSLLDLGEYSHLTLNCLSVGNLKKAALGASIIANPPFLILDEPSANLDPVQNRCLRDILAMRKESGNITLISSHNLHEIEKTCDEVIIINEGKIQATREISQFGQKNQTKVKITLSTPPHGFLKVVERCVGESSCKITGNSLTVTLPAGFPTEKLSLAITSANGVIIGFTQINTNLEDYYFSVLSK